MNFVINKNICLGSSSIRVVHLTSVDDWLGGYVHWVKCPPLVLLPRVFETLHLPYLPETSEDNTGDSAVLVSFSLLSRSSELQSAALVSARTTPNARNSY